MKYLAELAPTYRLIADELPPLNTKLILLNKYGCAFTGFYHPENGVKELTRLLADADDMITLHLSANTFSVSTDTLSLSCKLIQGKYPDYQRVIPKDTHNRFTVLTDCLKKSLSRVSVLADQNEKTIRLSASVENQNITLRGTNSQHEEADDQIECTPEGNPITAGFNSGYLLDALSNSKTEYSTLQFNDSGASCVISDDTFIHVIMAIRL